MSGVAGAMVSVSGVSMESVFSKVKKLSQTYKNLGLGNPEICLETPGVRGPCRPLIRRWTFDNGICKMFDYGGCQGNRNNFQSSAECKKTCPFLQCKVTMTCYFNVKGRVHLENNHFFNGRVH